MECEFNKKTTLQANRDKFLGLSLKSTRKSYYPQLKKQLEAVKENERHLQMIIDGLPAMIAYIDIHGRIKFVNRLCANQFNQPRSWLLGKSICDIPGLGDYLGLQSHLETILAGRRIQFEATVTTDKGDTQWLEITCVPDIHEKDRIVGFYLMALDQTEKKISEQERVRLEEHLRVAQKFESIGTLAGGIAHDFNNLLMGIQGHISLMEMDLESGHPLRDHIQSISKIVKSAVSLTRQLLGFARAGKYDVKPIDVNQLVTDSASMFSRTRKDIRIHIKLHETAMIVEADYGQLEQVLLNMYVNAWQAMPAGGHIYLQTQEVVLEEAFCQPHGMTPGSYVCISITDTGIGMDKATCNRVFDPFFTTKEKERGTGLGLASAYGIIKNHKGLITVYSEKDNGATFRIYLPLSQKKVHSTLSGGPEKADVKHEKATILLVDDEDMVRNVCRAMLEKLGYQVLACQSGQAALDLIRQRGLEIDMVLLDLIMPGMNGEQVFEKIHERFPDLPVVLASGYAIDQRAARILEQGASGFIQKPFNLAELSAKLNDILSKSGK